MFVPPYVLYCEFPAALRPDSGYNVQPNHKKVKVIFSILTNIFKDFYTILIMLFA